MRYLHYFIANLTDQIGTWYRSPVVPKPILPFENPSGLPPPQFTWLLFGLLRYLERKTWARQVYRERIRPLNLDDDDEPNLGVVPGLLEWSYRIDQQDSFLNNEVTGETIHIDLTTKRELIQSEQFLEYVRNLREPGAAEQKLRELFPEGKGMSVALNCLETFGVFDVYEFGEFDGMECGLCAGVRYYTQPVEAFLKAWRDTKNHLHLGAVIGDWDEVRLAAEANNQPEIATSAKTLAAQSRRRWLNRLRVEADDSFDPDALFGLAVAQSEDLEEYVKMALATPELVQTALEIIGNGGREAGGV